VLHDEYIQQTLHPDTMDRLRNEAFYYQWRELERVITETGCADVIKLDLTRMFMQPDVMETIARLERQLTWEPWMLIVPQVRRRLFVKRLTLLNVFDLRLNYLKRRPALQKLVNGNQRTEHPDAKKRYELSMRKEQGYPKAWPNQMIYAHVVYEILEKPEPQHAGDMFLTMDTFTEALRQYCTYREKSTIEVRCGTGQDVSRRVQQAVDQLRDRYEQTRTTAANGMNDDDNDDDEFEDQEIVLDGQDLGLVASAKIYSQGSEIRTNAPTLWTGLIAAINWIRKRGDIVLTRNPADRYDNPSPTLRQRAMNEPLIIETDLPSQRMPSNMRIYRIDVWKSMYRIVSYYNTFTQRLECVMPKHSAFRERANMIERSMQRVHGTGTAGAGELYSKDEWDRRYS
jgi:hypothetical protein